MVREAEEDGANKVPVKRSSETPVLLGLVDCCVPMENTGI